MHTRRVHTSSYTTYAYCRTRCGYVQPGSNLVQIPVLQATIKARFSFLTLARANRPLLSSSKSEDYENRKCIFGLNSGVLKLALFNPIIIINNPTEY